MRIIVPLQGVVQGRGGVFWGSLIPCALFYFLQLYIRQRRPNPAESDSEASDSEPDPKGSEDSPVPQESIFPKDSPVPRHGPQPNLPRTRSSGSNLARASSSGSNLARVGSLNDVNNYLGSSSRHGFSSRSPRRPSFVSARAISVLNAADSPYYIGWKEYHQNPFHAQENPDGIIQLGLAENRVRFLEPSLYMPFLVFPSYNYNVLFIISIIIYVPE